MDVGSKKVMKFEYALIVKSLIMTSVGRKTEDVQLMDVRLQLIRKRTQQKIPRLVAQMNIRQITFEMLVPKIKIKKAA